MINLSPPESLPPSTAAIRQQLIEETEAEVDPYENHCIGIGTHDDLKEFMLALRMVHFTEEDVHGRSVQRMHKDMEEHMGALTVENEKRVLADLEEVFTSLKKTLLGASQAIEHKHNRTGVFFFF